MPIGIICNAAAIILGGITGVLAGHHLTDAFRENLNMVFGACAMTMGIFSIVLMQNMPAVIFSVIAGTCLGLWLHLGDRIYRAASWLQKRIERFFPCTTGVPKEEYDRVLITALVLFCASGTGIYGSIVSGISGDNSILLSKSILDFPTSLIFACTLGAVTCFIAVPQFVIFMLLYLFAGAIFPLTTPVMINDFKACGGVLLLATAFRMLKLRDFPLADMIPAMIIVMPVSAFWSMLQPYL